MTMWGGGNPGPAQRARARRDMDNHACQFPSRAASRSSARPWRPRWDRKLLLTKLRIAEITPSLVAIRATAHIKPFAASADLVGRPSDNSKAQDTSQRKIILRSRHRTTGSWRSIVVARCHLLDFANPKVPIRDIFPYLGHARAHDKVSRVLN